MNQEQGPTLPATTVFSSLLTTIATLSGVAIGLGNVWRFPYMMGAYGGSAFLLIFLCFVILIGVPAMSAELALARTYRGATITVLRHAFGPPGRFLGYVLVFSVTVAASYYFVVVANVVFSAGYSTLVGFDMNSSGRFQTLLLNPYLQYTLAMIIAWTALWIIDRGLKAGIERVSNLIVPVFFLITVYLIIVALEQPGALQALSLFLQPDFSRTGFREVFAALGQVFFSMGLGATYILVYGKFLRADTSIRAAAGLTAFNDTAASVLASLFIVPTVLVYGLHMDAGPHLLFGTLPELFSRMGSGRLFGSLMLVALSLVAFLSVIASFQVITVSLSEEPIGERLGKRRLLVVAGIVVSVLMLVPASQPQLIASMDLLFGSAMTIIGCFFAVVAVAWRIKRQELWCQLDWQTDGSLWRSMFAVWLQWVIPVVLFMIMVGTVYNAVHADN